MSEDIITKLGQLYSKEMNKTQACAEKCLSVGFHILRKKDPLFILAVILILAVKVRERYDNAGIDEKIYYDTMSDIRIWCENSSKTGLENYGWLKNHVNFELFRIGRLQFQLYECKNKTLLYNKLPFSYGEKLIYVHIPQGEKLDKNSCEISLQRADEFFRSFFPSYNYRFYFCESWLLFEGNRDFMDENSNIVSFMSLFTHCYSVGVDAQAIERIFGKRCIFKKNYPEKTSLQKRAKAYMQKGNRLGIGVGFIEKKSNTV